MDGFQFILESPQATQSHKKRPRLVTSCDNWYDINVPVAFAAPAHSVLAVVSKKLSVYRLRRTPSARRAIRQNFLVGSAIENDIS
jgi:hypothetical protein